MSYGDIPDHMKLGYDYVVEMSAIRRELEAQGVRGTALHFECVRVYEDRHKADPSFKERQQAWLAKQKRTAAPDPVTAALMLIRDGHNNPRALARVTLESVGL